MNQETTKAILQNAWTFANDSLSTTLCLLWEPEVRVDYEIFYLDPYNYNNFTSLYGSK